MKRTISLLLSLVILLALVPFSALNVGADETVIDNVVYTLSEDGTYYIVSDFDEFVTSVTIPEEINDLPVKEIADSAFDQCWYVTSIEIPDSVTTIGKYAFAACYELTSIEIPENAVLGGDVFKGCSNLSYAEYENIKYYGSANNPYQIAYELVLSDLYTYTLHPRTKQLAGGLFSSCDDITSIEIPNSVTTIGVSAFSYCSGLISIEIPGSVTTIGGSSFSSCSSLKSIEIPDSVTYIGDYAFHECSDLTSIYIPDSVTTIGEYAFYNCSSLKSIKIPDSVTTIGDYAFNRCFNLESITVASGNERYYSSSNCLIEIETKTLIQGCNNSVIPTNGSVAVICDYAFAWCGSLTSVELGDFVTAIGDYAFAWCDSLTSIEMGNSVTTIGDDAFCSCDSLTSIEIPNSVTTIGNSAFYSCSSLKSIEIPNSVTTIGSGAFYNCSSLKSIEIPNSVTTIGSGAFYNCSSLTSIVIPDSVTTIGYRTFHYCDSLTSIVIPDSVTTIGEQVFYDCKSLKSIEIPDSVTSIGAQAFRDCSGLTDIYCEAEIQPEGWAVGYYDEGGWYIGGWNYGCDATVHWGVHLCDGEGDWLSDSSNHWKICACSEQVEVEVAPHTPGAEADCENDQICTVCDHVLVEAYGHSAKDNKWYSDGTNHWKLCACGEKVEIETHTPSAEADCENDQTCIVCEHVLVEAYGHSAKDNKWYSNGTNHWKLCACGEKVEIETHIPSAEADCENDQICTVCERVLVEAYGHSAKDDKWYFDENNHWHECNCGEHLDNSAHDCEWIVTLEPEVGVPGEKEYTCKVCGYVSETKTVPALEPEIQVGDVNGNGSLDTMDYPLLKRGYFGVYNVGDIAVVDINGNGEYDSMDYYLLKRVYFGVYQIQ